MSLSSTIFVAPLDLHPNRDQSQKSRASFAVLTPAKWKNIFYSLHTDEKDRWPADNYYWLSWQSFPSTWHTLDEIGHHGAEVSPDVLKDFCIFVILSFQEHSRQIHILQEESAQG